MLPTAGLFCLKLGWCHSTNFIHLATGIDPESEPLPPLGNPGNCSCEQHWQQAKLGTVVLWGLPPRLLFLYCYIEMECWEPFPTSAETRWKWQHPWPLVFHKGRKRKGGKNILGHLRPRGFWWLVSLLCLSQGWKEEPCMLGKASFSPGLRNVPICNSVLCR